MPSRRIAALTTPRYPDNSIALVIISRLLPLCVSGVAVAIYCLVIIGGISLSAVPRRSHTLKVGLFSRRLVSSCVRARIPE